MVYVKEREREDSGDARYLSCAVMDMHVVLGEKPDDDAKTMPLMELRADYLTVHDMRYNMTWAMSVDRHHFHLGSRLRAQ